MASYIEGISQAATASSATSSSSASKTASVLGKEDFLTLLVAQLQNQDPLNPDDPTEFTAQLAQFSSLEQLFNLNDSMENLATSNANADKFTTLNTIGKEVSYPGTTFTYSGEPVQLGYTLDGQASRVTLALQLDGATVATLSGTELGKGTHYLEWDGLTSDGQPAPSGQYKIVIQAEAAAGETVAATSLLRSEVTGVDLSGDYGGTLITRAGTVGFTSIVGVFEKKSTTAASTTETVNEIVETADTLIDTAAATTETITSSI